MHKKSLSDSVHSHPHLPSAGQIRPRAAFDQPTYRASEQINSRLQARLQRIRKLAAAEKEKAAAANATSNTNSDDTSEITASEYKNKMQPNKNLKQINTRTQSDVHLRLQRLDLRKVRALGSSSLCNAQEHKINGNSNRIVGCGRDRKTPPPGGLIKDSYSLLRSNSGDPNWREDGCRESIQEKNRTQSPQPLYEKRQIESTVQQLKGGTEEHNSNISSLSSSNKGSTIAKFSKSVII